MANVKIHIFGTNDYLEALDASVTYIKTASDLADITKINSSYSWSMKFPKSLNNRKVLDGLGHIGSGSRKPYEKIYCNLTVNGYPISVKALLNIKETKGQEYEIYVQEGFVDFLKDITVDTIGGTLDLTALNHTRNVSTIQASFSLTQPYAYLISDVNGAYKVNINSTTNLDPKYMTPFANVGYLWQAIFDYYGWTFNMNPTTQASIDETWVSYPSEILIENTPENEVLVGTVTAATSTGIQVNGAGKDAVIFDTLTLDPLFVEVVNPTTPYEFEIKQNGKYLIEYGSTGIFHLEDPDGSRWTSGYTNRLTVNGVLSDTGADNTDDTVVSHEVNLSVGDVVRLEVWGSGGAVDVSSEIYQALLRFTSLSQGQVDFTEALIKYKISDFIKEIMTREALTPYVDSGNKHIDFLTLDERMSYEVVDFSEYYVKREAESYLYNNYAQNNFLRHKHNDEVQTYGDGNLIIDNKNLAIEKNIYESKSFAPDENESFFRYNGTDYPVPLLRMFDVEITKEENELGEVTLIGDYKFLKDRFFFVKTTEGTNPIYIDGVLESTPPLASMDGAIFSDIITSQYGNFNAITQDAKVHTIKLALPLAMVVTLSLMNRFYFKQEAAFYVLNKLEYKTGEISTGEFLKVKPITL